MDLDICVPFWGDPTTFMHTIESVRNQTDPHWRLTIIDDAYPGHAIAERVTAIADPRIRYHRNETNVGITENFRRAVAAAEGSHVVVLGSDDLLLPEYVAHMRAVIAGDPDVDVIQPKVRVVDDDGHPARTLVDAVKLGLLTPRHATEFRAESMAATLLRGNWLYWPSLALRTETVSRIGFRDGLPIILDLALLIDIAFEGGRMRYTDVECFAYRRHAASLSQTALKDGTRFEDERQFYQETAQRAGAHGWRHARAAARFRLMSRLHAATQLPRALASGSSAAKKATWLLAAGR